jgi:hypothetical protein
MVKWPRLSMEERNKLKLEKETFRHYANILVLSMSKYDVGVQKSKHF